MLQPIFSEARGPSEMLADLHEEMRQRLHLPRLTRVAVAIHDPATDDLKTFLHSTHGKPPLLHYAAKLSACRSLLEIAASGEPRIIDDLRHPDDAPALHARRLADAGYRSSYTVPIRHNARLIGFLFFDSPDAGYFRDPTPDALVPYARIIALMVINEISQVRLFQAAVKTAREISHHRDEETAHHLERMSRYARLMALDLAGLHDLADDYIEYLFQCAPLHDIGKVGIPDEILLKPGRLSDAEFEVMKTHVLKGIAIVDGMARDFGLETLPHAAMLRNVVAYHHERYDGSGYPFGLRGPDIPLEARITAVADVFDALTSARPYKSAWSNEAALHYLQDNAASKFDPDCVAALTGRMAGVRDIQATFAEDRRRSGVA